MNITQTMDNSNRNKNRKSLNLKYNKHYLRYKLNIFDSHERKELIESKEFPSLNDIARYLNISHDSSKRIHDCYYMRPIKIKNKKHTDLQKFSIEKIKINENENLIS